MCRVRVLQRAGECVVQSMTEYEERFSRHREVDGGVIEVTGNPIVHPDWGRDTSLKIGTSTSVCGLTLTCLSEPVVLDAR